MRQLVNWLLIGAGGLMVVAELLLGAATGFDLALIGASLAIGGGIGLAFGSVKIGLFASGVLSLLYVGLIRQRVRNRLVGTGAASNADALLGRQGLVLVRLGLHEAGEVKVDDESWRAVLAPDAVEPKEPGSTVRVVSIEGVTLTVR